MVRKTGFPNADRVGAERGASGITKLNAAAVSDDAIPPEPAPIEPVEAIKAQGPADQQGKQKRGRREETKIAEESP